MQDLPIFGVVQRIDDLRGHRQVEAVHSDVLSVSSLQRSFAQELFWMRKVKPVCLAPCFVVELHENVLRPDLSPG
jgi:hypothetical protein